MKELGYFDTAQSDNDTEHNGGYSCIHQSEVTYGGDTRIHDADEMNPNNANCSSPGPLATSPPALTCVCTKLFSLPEASLLAFVCTWFF